MCLEASNVLSMSGIKVCVNLGKATVIRMKSELVMARCPEVAIVVFIVCSPFFMLLSGELKQSPCQAGKVAFKFNVRR